MMRRMMMGICGSMMLVPSAFADGALFDVKARKAELQTSAFAVAKSYCMADGVAFKAKLKPITGLKPTEGYGSDNRAEDFSWAVMVLGGRALAGDADSTTQLTDMLMKWAKADAFEKTTESHDSYYALKRVLLPVIVSYSIIYDDLSPAERKTLETWIDPLVRRVDKKFNGDVDVNNHRYLADSVLMAWGQMMGDDALYQKGITQYKRALSHARADGGLPLEVRRGARAAWYMRQSLANLGVMAEVARQRGEDLYATDVDGKDYALLLTYYLNVVQTPLIGQADAADNYKPGPASDFLTQDRGMLETRPNQRHYMAFAEALLMHYPDGFIKQRLQGLFSRMLAKRRPLIDDFSGGNGTCFWMGGK